MLSLQDGVARLWRYKINYTETSLEVTETEGGELKTTQSIAERVHHVTSAESRDTWVDMYPDASVEEVDQTGNEWIDGLEFSSRDEALAALEKGEDDYKAKQSSDIARLIDLLAENGQITREQHDKVLDLI